MTAASSIQPSVDELRERFASRGQGHVFRFWSRLDASARARLASQAAGLDLDGLAQALAGARCRAAAPPRPLEPAPVERLPGRGGDAPRWACARDAGEALLRAGSVAVLVVAGGQGSRLGFAGPKGAFPVGPVSQRTLFELQAQRIRRLRGRYGVAMPWYVMTSEATDSATRDLFDAHGMFGLPREDVFFLRQASMPALDFEGRLVLDRPDHVFESPDGHGGVVAALVRSGALDDLASRGCTTLFLWQVDNPLVRIADPVYLGLHAGSGAEVSCKVIAKRDPMEKVGHVVRIDGRVGVVEYTEIDPAQRDARGADGALRLWAGGISIYVFETAFLQRIARDADGVLPFHASAKTVPTLDAAGAPVATPEPNAWKLERFLFDVLPCAERVSVVETDRDEYSPLKNATGGESPARVRRDLSAVYRGWLAEAGIALPEGDALVEIDQSLYDGASDFVARGIARVDQAGAAIRIANGAST